MNQSGLHCRANTVDDGIIREKVTCTADDSLGVKTMAAYHPIQGELVARCLDSQGRTIDFVQQDEPTFVAGRNRIAFQGKGIRGFVGGLVTVQKREA